MSLEQPKTPADSTAEKNDRLNLLTASEDRIGKSDGKSIAGSNVRVAEVTIRDAVLTDAVQVPPLPGFDKPAQAKSPGDNGPVLAASSVAPGIVKLVAPALRPGEPAAERWGKVVDLINKTAEDPTTVVARAFHDSRVVGFGELHEFIGSEFRQWGIDSMKALAAAGMTHLAVEFPANLQPYLDQFQKDGKLTIPPHLYNPDGSIDNSDAAKGSLEFLKAMVAREQQSDPKYFDMLKAASAAGIKLVAVDRPDTYADLGRGTAPAQMAAFLKKAESPSVLAQRNQYMAKRIMGVVNGTVEPLAGKSKVAKVGVWLGMEHIADSHGASGQPSAFELVRQQLEKKGERYTSFYGQADTSMAFFAHEMRPSVQWPTMFALSSSVERPAAIATHTPAGTANVLGDVKDYVGSGPVPVRKMSDWDYVLLFSKMP